MKSSKRKNPHHRSSSDRTNNNALFKFILIFFLAGLPTYAFFIFSTDATKQKAADYIYNVKNSVFGFSQQSISAPLSEKPTEPEIIIKKEVQYIPQQIKKEQKSETIYSWVDNEGVMHFSNTPPEKEIQHFETMKTVSRSYTSIIMKGNSVIVPVEIGLNGTILSTELLFDTGATLTSLHESEASLLPISNFFPGKSKIADGSIVQTKIAKVDYIKVGPNRIDNFTISIMKQKNDSEAHKGLLGMNFIKNVDFEIDYDQKVILW